MKYIADLFNNCITSEKRLSGEKFGQLLNNMQRMMSIHSFLFSQCSASHSELELIFTALDFAAENNGEHITVAAAAKKLRVSASSISRTLRTLSEREMVTRYCDNSDRRTVRIVVTRQGEEMFLEMLSYVCKVMDKAMKSFSNEEMSTMIDLHERLINSVENTIMAIPHN